MAGYNYWFPKAFGFTLDERWGKAAFWCWLIGFYLAFMPLYVLGLMGMTRRLQHYDDLELAAAGCWSRWSVPSSSWRASSARSCSSSCRSARREQLRDVTGDPWNGRTLEWSTASPPPAYNFAVLPRSPGETPSGTGSNARRRSRISRRKRATTSRSKCRETAPTGFVTAFFAVVIGFALIWHIWWMAALGLLGAFVTLLAFAFRDEEEIEIPAEQIARVRSRSPGGGCTMNIAVAIDDVRHEALPSCKRGRSRSEADRRCLRLLDLPPQRHRDVLGAVCGLRGARACDRGRSDRRAAVQSGQRRDRDRVSARLELHLRADVAGGQFAAPCRHLFLALLSPSCSARPSSLSRSANSPA